MPVYNEARTIGTVLRKALALDLTKEVIVVKDGSTDRTLGIIRPFPGRMCLRAAGVCVRRPATQNSDGPNLGR